MDAALKDFADKYKLVGESKFYRVILTCAINKLIKIRDNEYKGISPELEFLDYSERFLFLYRREANDAYLDLAKIFRKAGHKVYRIMLKKEMTTKNSKFLNII